MPASAYLTILLFGVLVVCGLGLLDARAARQSAARSRYERARANRAAHRARQRHAARVDPRLSPRLAALAAECLN